MSIATITNALANLPMSRFLVEFSMSSIAHTICACRYQVSCVLAGAHEPAGLLVLVRLLRFNDKKNTCKKVVMSSYLVCVQLAVHLKGLMVVQETHWTLWAAVGLQYYHKDNDTCTM